MHRETERRAKIISDSSSRPECCSMCKAKAVSPAHSQTNPSRKSLSLPLAARFSASRKEMNKVAARAGRSAAHQQPRAHTHTHTEPYSIKAQLSLGPSQKSTLSGYISLMFTIGRRRNALSPDLFGRAANGCAQAKVGSACLQGCLSFPRHAQEATHQKTKT